MKRTIVVLITALFVFSGSIAQAVPRKKVKKVVKEESATVMALGFNNQLSRVGLSSLALRIWLNDSIGIEPVLGFSVGGTNTAFDVGGKFGTDWP